MNPQVSDTTDAVGLEQAEKSPKNAMHICPSKHFRQREKRESRSIEKRFYDTEPIEINDFQ